MPNSAIGLDDDDEDDDEHEKKHGGPAPIPEAIAGPDRVRVISYGPVSAFLLWPYVI